MICSTTTPTLFSSSYSAGVAETYITWPTRFSHSSKRSGRLSSADGSRKPKSTSVFLRWRSPRNMPPICGTVTWLSSTKQRKSLGK